MSMRSLTQFDITKDFPALLAAEKMDVAEGIGKATTKIAPDTTNRTILIGLGGTGVQTINYVKRTISEKLNPNWTEYVAFLAIDSDGKELAAADSLTSAEYISTTRTGISNRLSSPVNYPPAWHKFLDPDQARLIEDPNSDGSGQKRLLGKAKFHDLVQANNAAVDVEIVDKLTERKNTLAGLGSTGKYEVYVIGGICGGTGSGGFLEMPALIRKVLGNGDNVNIYAMLFLPDTLTAKPSISKDQSFVESLQANGYASLKELNYFQGMTMRPGYPEKWYYNGGGTPELVMDSSTGFFRIPYLIGTSSGPADNSLEIARSTVAEFFISILGKMLTSGQNQFLTESFASNALQFRGDKGPDSQNMDKEPNGAYHEYPKAFGTLGFASAQAPQQIVKAYAVTSACSRAGLEPITREQRAERISRGETFLPFLGSGELMTARAGTDKAKELLEPVLTFLRSYQTSEFSFLARQQLDNVSFNDIRNNTYSANLDQIVDNYVKGMTGQNMKDALDQRLAEAFNKFRENVKAYVMKDGPMAFWNLFMGTFIPENNFEGVGIKRMLANLVEDKLPEEGRANTWNTSANAKSDVTRRYNDIAQAGALSHIGRRQSMANEWLIAVDTWANLCVNEKRREHVLGRYHALEKKIAEPAAILAEQVRAFGGILHCMASGYKAYSSKLEDYQAFRKTESNPTDVNIAALNTSAYDFIKAEAERIAETISGTKIREALVNSFFDKPGAWLDVDDNLIKQATDAVYLRDEMRPVPAREMFDRCMASTVNFDMDVSIQKLFTQISQTVSHNQYAEDIVERLDLQSQFLFDGNTGGKEHKYLVYPAHLDGAIVTAIQNAARAKGISGFYESDYADSIMMYRFAAPFEVYQLNHLKEWEQQYLRRQANSNNLLHGRSPDIREEKTANGSVYYVDNSHWFDYPSICPEEDPTRMRPGGIPHEGEVRLEIDKLLKKALELGVLYSEQVNGGWCYSRIHFDRYLDWRFDEFALTPVDQVGHLPTGKALAEAVARMNRCEFRDLTRVVKLHNGGLMETPRSTEQWAWTYAKRVLYAHRPMLKEIRETVELMEKWNAVVAEVNMEIDRGMLPARLIRIMQSHLIYRDDNGVWKNEDDDTILVNLSPMMINQLKFRNPRVAALLTGGFELFALHLLLTARGEAEYHKLIDALLPKAQDVIMQFKDPELLQTTFEWVDGKLTKECELLEGYGADLADPDGKPTAGFVKKMADLRIQAEMLPELCKFYCCAKMWDQC